MIDLPHQQLYMVLVTLPLGQVVEMADDAGPTIWKRDALDLPVIGFGSINVGTPPDRALRGVGLPRRKRVAEASNGLRGEWVWPDEAQHLGEVAPDQRPNV